MIALQKAWRRGNGSPPAGKAEEVKYMPRIAKVGCLMVWDENMAIEMTKALGSELDNQVRVKVVCNHPNNNNTVD